MRVFVTIITQQISCNNSSKGFDLYVLYTLLVQYFPTSYRSVPLFFFNDYTSLLVIQCLCKPIQMSQYKLLSVTLQLQAHTGHGVFLTYSHFLVYVFHNSGQYMYSLQPEQNQTSLSQAYTVYTRRSLLTQSHHLHSICSRLQNCKQTV